MAYVVALLILLVALILSEVVIGDRALRRYADKLQELTLRTAASENRLRQKIFEYKLLTEQLEQKTSECKRLGWDLDQLKAENILLRQQVQTSTRPPEPVHEIHTKESPYDPVSMEALAERVQTVGELIDFWRKTSLNSRSA